MQTKISLERLLAGSSRLQDHIQRNCVIRSVTVDSCVRALSCRTVSLRAYFPNTCPPARNTCSTSLPGRANGRMLTNERTNQQTNELSITTNTIDHNIPRWSKIPQKYYIKRYYILRYYIKRQRFTLYLLTYLLTCS